MSTDFDRNPGFLINDVARLMRRAFDRRVKQLGLTRSQWFVLAHLYRRNGLTQSELADELDMERAPTGKLIDRLEAKGWIERRPDERDRRLKRIHCAATLDPMFREMGKASKKLFDDAFEGVTDKQIDVMIEALLAAKTNLLRQDE